MPLTRPWIGSKEKSSVAEVLGTGWLTQGTQVKAFEEGIASYVGTKHGIACTNGTTALHLALILAGVGPGDEVVIPSFTWIATANVVRMVGAIPVFADIELETFNVTIESIEAVLTQDTRVIMPVHQFGMPVDMDPIREIADQKDVVIIEDAACALGAEYKGIKLGNLSPLVCFSFHPRKILTTGEGGMVMTSDDAYADRARSLRNHGASVSDLLKHESSSVQTFQSEAFNEMGYNYRMTDIQAALGLAQMERLDENVALRRRRAQRYNDAFAEIPYLLPTEPPSYAKSNWQSYPVRIAPDAPIPRDIVAQRLLESGVACRPGYMACHVEPLYRTLYPKVSLPNTEEILETLLILPLFPQMTDADQDHVISSLIQAM